MTVLIGGPLHGMIRHDIDINGQLIGTRVPIHNANRERAFVTVTETIPLPTQDTFHEYEVRMHWGTAYLCWPDFTPDVEQPGLLEHHLTYNPQHPQTQAAVNTAMADIIIDDNVPEGQTWPREFTAEFAREHDLATENMIRDENRQVYMAPPALPTWAANTTAEGGQFTEEQFFRTMQAIRNDTGYARLTNVT